MLEQPPIIEALEGLEGAERYKALNNMLGAARSKGVVRFDKETRETAGIALTEGLEGLRKACARRARRPRWMMTKTHLESLDSGRPAL
jgi:hypothetical protein